MDKNKETGKRLGLNGLAVVAALLVLYGISCTVVKSWQIYTDEFSGTLELCGSSLLISAIWLALYWFLDRVQHESLKMTVLTFSLGSVAYISSKTVLDWFIGSNISVFMENIGLPVLSFFIVFVFFATRFQSFDELVDSFIYGGFTGVGIAFAACMTEFLHYTSLDGQFVIISLITKIAVHAAICSLAGFMIHQALLKKKTVKIIISLIAMAVLFALDYIVEQIMMSDLSFAEIEIIPVLIAAVFALVLVGIVVILVHRTLKKDVNGENSLEIPVSSVPAIITCVLVVLFIIFALVVRKDIYKNTKFESNNQKYTFNLPQGWSEVEETSNESIFNFDIPTGNVFYKNETGSINLYLFYDSKEKLENPFPLSSENGWDISLQYNQFIARDSYSNPFIMYQTTYSIKKGDESVLIDVFSDTKRDSEAERAVRILIRTLEAKND